LARIAFLCPPFAAHLACFRALGEGLRRCGHQPFFLLNAGASEPPGDIPVHHVPLRSKDPDVGKVLTSAEKPGGLIATLRTIADSAALTDQLCDGGRAELKALGADTVVGDQMEPAGYLLAKALRLPFVGVACAVPIDSAPGVPLPFLNWPFEPAAHRKHRRTASIADALSRRQNQVIAGWAERFGIAPHRSLQDCLAAVQVAQMVPELDFPRPEPLPFVPVGPLRRAEELADAPLPFGVPDGTPLVFASMGTLLGGDLKLWRVLAKACREAGTALVLAHGGRLSAAGVAGLDVHHAAAFLPYRAVMRRAALVITHGGSNTVLDALSCGVPLLIRPVGFDQPGNLARIRHHGLGEELASLRRPLAIAEQIGRLVKDTAMRSRCERVGQALDGAGGVERAVSVIEKALTA
jgi:zeaxanthin glucosyltransferase